MSVPMGKTRAEMQDTFPKEKLVRIYIGNEAGHGFIQFRGPGYYWVLSSEKHLFTRADG